MKDKKKKHPREKTRLHPRNKHRNQYNFDELIKTCPDLKAFVSLNKFQDESIDFSNPEAVKMLNRALLMHYYGIENWEIPENYLCPPIPGRADYIHYIADLLCSNNYGKMPRGSQIKCLDIGVGANCVYPIIGTTEYGWSFIGADIDPKAIDSANNIIQSNASLKGKIECRLQNDPKDYFYGVLPKDEIIDLSVCNPPFHASQAEAQAATLRKLSNLNAKKTTKATLNFGGQNNELWCDGGEERFVRNMIRQSKKFASNCYLFSSLISKQSTLKSIYKVLKECEATITETINMGQGNKTSRIVAWSFLSKEEQLKWKNARWSQDKS